MLRLLKSELGITALWPPNSEAGIEPNSLNSILIVITKEIFTHSVLFSKRRFTASDETVRRRDSLQPQITALNSVSEKSCFLPHFSWRNTFPTHPNASSTNQRRHCYRGDSNSAVWSQKSPFEISVFLLPEPLKVAGHCSAVLLATS